MFEISSLMLETINDCQNGGLVYIVIWLIAFYLTEDLEMEFYVIKEVLISIVFIKIQYIYILLLLD